MITLLPSEVMFDEAQHTYSDASGKRYSGITSLIHDILRLGVYPTADDYARQVAIPRAGHYGTCVHQAIQMYDTIGIEATTFPAKQVDTPVFGPVEFPAHDVSHELQHYIRMRADRSVVASEFTVSWGDYASQIDSIWTDDGKSVILVDFKTNNLDYYPGGADGLKEYISWQLSCYAFMFEHQCHVKVAALMGMHLRADDAQLWDITRQPDDRVQCLLSSECVLQDDGRFAFFNPDMQVADPVQVQRQQAAALMVPAEVTTAIARLLQAEREAKEMKNRLEQLMRDNGVTKWECDEFTATIGKDSTTTRLDSKALRNEFPDIYEQFTTTAPRKGAFKITPR